MTTTPVAQVVAEALAEAIASLPVEHYLVQVRHPFDGAWYAVGSTETAGQAVRLAREFKTRTGYRARIETLATGVCRELAN